MADKLPMEMILEVLFASAIVSMETLLTASQITRDYRNCYTAHKTRLLLTVAQLSEYSEYIMTYGFLLSKYSYKEYISALHAIPSQFKPAVPRASQGFTAGAPSLLAWLREKGEEDMEGVYIRALEVHCSIQQVAKKCADYTAVIYQNHLISRLENRERASILRLYETDRELCIKAAYLTACHTARVGRTGTLGEICTRTLNATSQFVRFMQLVVIEAIRESGDEPIDYLRKLWCEAVASACVKPKFCIEELAEPVGKHLAMMYVLGLTYRNPQHVDEYFDRPVWRRIYSLVRTKGLERERVLMDWLLFGDERVMIGMLEVVARYNPPGRFAQSRTRRSK